MAKELFFGDLEEQKHLSSVDMVAGMISAIVIVSCLEGIFKVTLYNTFFS